MAKKDPSILNKRERAILDYIEKQAKINGYPPSVREIGKAVGLKSTATVHGYLAKLEEKGYIKKSDNKNRTIEILVPNEYLEKDEQVVDIPLLGKVTAGSPIEAIEVPDEYFSVPAAMINSKKEMFSLRVSGESMINVGIYDGDIIIVERKNTAINGETVVAMTEDNEVTVKTFYKEKGYFRLQPENDTMAPIILDKVNILGKVVGLYRKF